MKKLIFILVLLIGLPQLGYSQKSSLSPDKISAEFPSNIVTDLSNDLLEMISDCASGIFCH